MKKSMEIKKSIFEAHLQIVAKPIQKLKTYPLTDGYLLSHNYRPKSLIYELCTVHLGNRRVFSVKYKKKMHLIDK